MGGVSGSEAGEVVGPVTQLLQDWSRGDRRALEQLVPLVYRDLRQQAAAYLRRERKNHTLVATALVHEAFLRMAGQKPDYKNRAHFFGVAAGMMRRVLVDHARVRNAAKRPRPELQVALDADVAAVGSEALDILSLDEALDELSAIDARQARLVELRYFGGLTAEEAAVVLAVSVATIKRDWRLAKAWLYRRLAPKDGRQAPP